jgi:hypothetical protein
VNILIAALLNPFGQVQNRKRLLCVAAGGRRGEERRIEVPGKLLSRVIYLYK